MKLNSLAVLVAMAASSVAYAEDFAALDQAIPSADVYNLAPVFDFDGNGCLPSAGISRTGEMNDGLNASGSITGGCRTNSFLNSSNTMHRQACMTHRGDEYCAHIYSLYFEKDQATIFGGGHRHDWEHATVWSKNGQVTHGSYSAHGDSFTKSANELEFEGNHLKIVYHKDGILTHALRFAKNSESAENPYGRWVTPNIASWFSAYGNGVSNAQMRSYLNTYNYGSATLPTKDSKFLGNINRFKPWNYPTFTQASMNASALTQAVYTSTPWFVGSVVSLRSSDGDFVRAKGGGGSGVKADRSSPSTHESFKIEDIGGGKVAIMSYDNSYLRANNGGGSSIWFDRGSIGDHEKWTPVQVSGGKWAFKCANGNYLVAENGGGGSLNCNRTSVGSWESFTVSTY